MAIKHRIRTEKFHTPELFYRDGNTEGTKVVSLTARKAIRLFCRECMGFQNYEVRKCTDVLCPLFPFRTSDPTYVKPKKSSDCIVESNGKLETKRKEVTHTKPLLDDKMVEESVLVKV